MVVNWVKSRKSTRKHHESSSSRRFHQATWSRWLLEIGRRQRPRLTVTVTGLQQSRKLLIRRVKVLCRSSNHANRQTMHLCLLVGLSSLSPLKPWLVRLIQRPLTPKWSPNSRNRHTKSQPSTAARARRQARTLPSVSELQFRRKSQAKRRAQSLLPSLSHRSLCRHFRAPGSKWEACLTPRTCSWWMRVFLRALI